MTSCVILMFLQESEYSTTPFGSTTFSNVFINLKYYPEYNNFNCFEQKISECGCKNSQPLSVLLD